MVTRSGMGTEAGALMTLRKRAIATLRAGGFSRAEIATALGISGSTYDREIRAMRLDADPAKTLDSARSHERMMMQLAAAAEE